MPAPDQYASSALPVYHTEQELLEQFAAIGFEKQLDLGEVIGERNWNVDLTTSEISFGDGFTFAMQALGTFSRESDTWLWAWANTQTPFTEAGTRQARQLRQYGEANGIALLANPDCEATAGDLHRLGLIAVGFFNASGYYLADYGQGIMLLTLTSPQLEAARRENDYRVFRVFSEVISQFEMRHQPALAAYLQAKGYEVSTNPHTLTATKNGNTVTASFDELGRLTKLGGQPGQAAPGQ
ncbi:MAG: DUF6882 domain-containing protein [Janthinobacterium lividum]